MTEICDTTREGLRAHLRDAGLRATPARIAVLRALLTADAPLSHADVTLLLDDDGYDRATVFRNLTALVESGVARRVDLGDHTWRFEVVRDQAGVSRAPHPHFLCTECGQLQRAEGVRVEIPRTRGLPRAVQAGVVQVQLRGVCDRCD